MKPLIREGGWVSCAFDTVGEPKQLDKNELKIFCLDSSKCMLTKYDTSLTHNFTCKSPVKFVCGGVGLGLGLILGAGLSIPVVGWIAIAVIAIIAIIASLIYATTLCTSGLQGMLWNNYHDSIKYHGKEAIMYLHSTLECSNGGILIASETYGQANAISNKMALNNIAEIGLHTLSQFGMGFLLGKFGPTSAPGIAVNMTLTGGLYVSGETIFGDNAAMNNSLGFVKILSVDKYTYLFENLKNPTFGGYFGGAGISILAMGIDYGSNIAESSLESGNEEYIDALANGEEIEISNWRKKHYSRNQYNYIDGLSYDDVANDPNWELYSEDKSIYHNDGIGKPELKFVHKDGREIIFDGDTHEVVTDPNLEGTYNFSNPDGIDGTIMHAIQDVLPYYLWGNSFDDDTTFWQRITGNIPRNKNAKIFAQNY